MEKKTKKYTDTQYKKDKKKLIGIGFLLMAGIVIFLHLWNMGRLEEIRIGAERFEREKIEMGITASPVSPDFQDIIDKKIDEIWDLKQKEVVYNEKDFPNFKITIPETWQEIQKKEIETLEIVKEMNKINANILFLAHNLNIEMLLLEKMKQDGVKIEDWGIPQLPELQKTDIIMDTTLFSILEFKELNNFDYFTNFIIQFDKNREDFEKIKWKIEEIDKNQIKVNGKYLIFLPEIENYMYLYSYKKIKIIDKNFYVFIFLRFSEITEKNKEEFDSLLRSVIINLEAKK